MLVVDVVRTGIAVEGGLGLLATDEEKSVLLGTAEDEVTPLSTEDEGLLLETKDEEVVLLEVTEDRLETLSTEEAEE